MWNQWSPQNLSLEQFGVCLITQRVNEKAGESSACGKGSVFFRGQSLDDNILSGPDLRQNLVLFLLRFRKRPIAVIADSRHRSHVYANKQYIERPSRTALPLVDWKFESPIPVHV